jgi:glucosyl-3-phosphoglycerate synthase
VDVGLLIDVVRRHGLGRIAMADLGIRVHRNRPLAQLAPQAFEVLHAILRRADVDLPATPHLVGADGEPVATNVEERPALDTLPRAWFERPLG